jgi:hypothetical protein
MEPTSDVIRHFHPVLPAHSLGTRRCAWRWPAVPTSSSGRRGPARRARGRVSHRFAPLSKGRVRADGRLQCPYHGCTSTRRGAAPTPANRSCATATCAASRWWSATATSGWPSGTRPCPPCRTWRPTSTSTAAPSPALQAPLHGRSTTSARTSTPLTSTPAWAGRAARGPGGVEAHHFDDRTEVRYRGRQRVAPFLRLLACSTATSSRTDG